MHVILVFLKHFTLQINTELDTSWLLCPQSQLQLKNHHEKYPYLILSWVLCTTNSFNKIKNMNVITWKMAPPKGERQQFIVLSIPQDKNHFEELGANFILNDVNKIPGIFKYPKIGASCRCNWYLALRLIKFMTSTTPLSNLSTLRNFM